MDEIGWSRLERIFLWQEGKILFYVVEVGVGFISAS